MTQLVTHQSDSALKEQLSQLQQQIEALMSGKANKADLDALQLHAAVVGGGSSGSDVKGDSDVHGAATTSSGSSASGECAALGPFFAMSAATFNCC